MYIPPSGLLSAENSSSMSSFNKKYNNTPVRMGCIVKTYDIKDKSNNSNSTENGAVPQYDVVTEEQSVSGGQSYVKYTNCISITGFGGIADFFEYKLRDSTESFEETYDFKKQNGNMVLILCLDGFSEKAVIIGSVKHYEKKSTLTKEAGLHLEGEYNGLNWKVNKDGELTVTFKSKTDNEGKPQDETAGGSYAKIDKTGSIEFNTNDEAFVKIDKPGKNINVEVGNDISLKAKNDLNIAVDSKISASAKSDISFAAEGSAKYSSKSSITIEGKSLATIKGGDVKIEGDNSITAKATKVVINAPKTLIGPSPKPAIILTTKFIGVGNLGGPVVCSAVGPFSSNVLIS